MPGMPSLSRMVHVLYIPRPKRAILLCMSARDFTCQVHQLRLPQDIDVAYMLQYSGDSGGPLIAVLLLSPL